MTLFEIDKEDLENGLDEFQVNEVLRWKEIIEKLKTRLESIDYDIKHNKSDFNYSNEYELVKKELLSLYNLKETSKK